jgi:hypothetical protein
LSKERELLQEALEWMHCEERKVKADVKKARKLLRNKNAQDRIKEFK